MIAAECQAGRPTLNVVLEGETQRRSPKSGLRFFFRDAVRAFPNSRFRCLWDQTADKVKHLLKTQTLAANYFEIIKIKNVN